MGTGEAGGSGGDKSVGSGPAAGGDKSGGSASRAGEAGSFSGSASRPGGGTTRFGDGEASGRSSRSGGDGKFGSNEGAKAGKSESPSLGKGRNQDVGAAGKSKSIRSESAPGSKSERTTPTKPGDKNQANQGQSKEGAGQGTGRKDAEPGQSSRSDAEPASDRPDISKTFRHTSTVKGDRFQDQSTGFLGKPGEVQTHRDPSAQQEVSGGKKADAGHRIGDRFGPSGGKENLAEQNSNMNRSAQKKIENAWANYRKAGLEVKADVTDFGPKGALRTRPGGSSRPRSTPQTTPRSRSRPRSSCSSTLTTMPAVRPGDQESGLGSEGQPGRRRPVHDKEG